MELSRGRGVATWVVFPVTDGAGNLVGGITSWSVMERVGWDQGGSPGSPTALTNTPLEVSANTGYYKLQLTSSETNNDYIVLRLVPSGVSGKPVILQINTRYSPLSDTSGYVTVSALTSSAINNLLDSASAIEPNITMRGALRLMLSALAGVLTGAASGRIEVRNTANTKTRITAEVDPLGNRINVLYDTT